MSDCRAKKCTLFLSPLPLRCEHAYSSAWPFIHIFYHVIVNSLSQDTVQPCHLFKPNGKHSFSHGIFAPSHISTQFLLQSVCVCVRAHACMIYDTDQRRTHLNSLLLFLCVWGAGGRGRVFSFSFRMVLCVGCFGGTVLYVCIEYHI